MLSVLRLMVCWYFRMPVSQAAMHAKVAQVTAVDFYSFCREVCRVVHTHDEVQIRLPGDVVECDENHLLTRKHHRGRMLKRSLWVFGRISRLTRRRFVVQIRDTSQNTLWPLMQKHITQGTFIMTDQHRSYTNCEVLGFSGHVAINHSRYYVRLVPAFVPGSHPSLGRVIPTLNMTRVSAHLNTKDRGWRELKAHIRQCRFVRLVPNYIDQFLYFENVLNLSIPNKRRYQLQKTSV